MQDFLNVAMFGFYFITQSDSEPFYVNNTIGGGVTEYNVLRVKSVFALEFGLTLKVPMWPKLAKGLLYRPLYEIRIFAFCLLHNSPTGRRNIDGLDECSIVSGKTFFYGCIGSCDIPEYTSLSHVGGNVLLSIYINFLGREATCEMSK